MEWIEISEKEYTSIYFGSNVDSVDDQTDFVERKSFDNQNELICIKVEQLRYDETGDNDEWQVRYYKPTNKED